MRIELVSLLVLLSTQAEAAQAAKRIAIIVGNNRADASRLPLRFAERDARQMSRVLESLGGVGEAHLLLDRPASALAETLRTIANELEGGDEAEPATIFFFYSGHADDRALLMQDSRFPFTELKAALTALPAALFVAFIDACQAGSISRLKGGSAVPVVDVDLYGGGDASTSGGVFITSGGPGENAQESDELEASFFTHFLLSGLRGAADDSGDRRVSLDEAYRFAYRHTLARTQGTLLGPQHATYHVNVAGRGQLVLTWLSERSSYLILPDGTSGTYYLRDAERDELIAEVIKRAPERLRIGVDPGRYEVSRAEDGFLFSQTIAVQPKSELTVDEARMSARPLVSSASKGPPVGSTAGFGLMYRLRSGYLRDAGLAHGASALFLTDLGPLRIGPLVSWTFGRYRRADGIAVATTDLEAGARIGMSWYVLPRLSVLAGVELGVAWTTQVGRYGDGANRISTATFPERAVLGLEVELLSPFALFLLGQAGIVAYATPDGPTARFIAGGAAGIEVRL